MLLVAEMWLKAQQTEGRGCRRRREGTLDGETRKWMKGLDVERRENASVAPLDS